VRTTVGSHLGHTPGMLVELDCIAYAPAKTEKKQPRATKRKSAKRRR
jgi:hypothetical protein